eukprot:TRINITY_DN16654_c0_g1_i1.p1 TRINITY_DN16654_c0_g1~~TRINITY_DN16654_c0_g1_i1.p1  ORF type:complete len:525 (+),score=55.14 TRINITY_DN16654_c0_g1_i1:160-1734(+)
MSESHTLLDAGSVVGHPDAPDSDAYDDKTSDTHVDIPSETIDDDHDLRLGVADDDRHAVRTRSRLFLLGLTLSSIGMDLAWGLEFSAAVPYFQSQLKLGSVVAQAMWAFGPISGFITAPMIMMLSDRHRSRFGRRRPFLVLGMVLVLICSSVFSNAREIGEFFGDSRDNPFIAQVVGCTAFALNDFSVNIMQWPLRTLVADLVPNHQQTSAQAMLTVNAGLGTLLANGFIFLFVDLNRAPLIFFVGNIVMVLTMLVTLVVGKERPTNTGPPPPADGRSCLLFHKTKEVATAALHLKPGMKHTMVVLALTWAGFFCSFTIITSYLGRVVYGGDPTANPGQPGYSEYQQGVRMGSLAYMLRAVAQVVTSFCLDSVTRLLGFRNVYSGALLLMAAAMTGLVVYPSVYLSPCLVGLLGITYACSNSLPFSIAAGLYPDPAIRGVHMSLLNWSVTVPQLIDTGYTGFLTDLWDERLPFAFAIGFALLASFCAKWVLTREDIDESGVMKPKGEAYVSLDDVKEVRAVEDD